MLLYASRRLTHTKEVLMARNEQERLTELLRAIELDALIRKDIKLEEAFSSENVSPLEELLDRVKKEGKVRPSTGKLDGRAAAGKARKKKNAKRRAKAAEQGRWRRSWNKRMLEQAFEGNYYAYLAGRWKRRGRPLLMTEEEWLEHVQPCIPKGIVVELRRYIPKQGASLDNIVVYNAGTGEVLFDGKEWLLKQQGHIL